MIQPLYWSACSYYPGWLLRRPDTERIHMTNAQTAAPLKVYWQPGCSSCLKTKEFLLENGVEFESINVLEDETGFRDLKALGLQLVPVVARGSDWANGAVFRDVARIAGFEWQQHDMLAPGDIVTRINTILAAAGRYLAQIPEAQLDTMLPHRPRSYRQLSYHIFQIPQVFLKHVENNEPYTYDALISQLPADINTRDDLMHYARSVQDRLSRWWAAKGTSTDFNQPGNVYYGEVSLHEVLERTAWHSGQHTRQLMLTLETIGIQPDVPLQASDFSGLPMPRNTWDNEKDWS